MNEIIASPKDGQTLFIRSWPVERPRAVIQIAHGAIDHSGRYERAAQAFNAAGISVLAQDLRGHGRTATSQRKLGIGSLDVWDEMVHDLRYVTDLIRARDRELPIFLLGNSLGSLIVQDYLQRSAVGLSGAILCGTFGHLRNLEVLIEQLEPITQGVFCDQPSRLFQSIFARFNVAYQPDRTGCAWLTSDEREIQQFVSDPLCRFAYSNAFGLSILRGARRMWKDENENRLPHELPVLFLSGADDAAGENTAAVLPLIDRYRAHGVQRVDVHFFANTRHELFMEPSRDEMCRLIIQWIERLLRAKQIEISALRDQ